jgi:hypothetical protein
MRRWAARAGAALVGLMAGVLAFAGVAYAHVEVSADPAVEGATNAVVRFSAEAEDPNAGVVSVRIVLPAGLTVEDVSLNKAPDGWAFTPASDGYTVGGPALPKGQDAVHSIIVTHLPDMPSLIFKAIVSYADGTADHWIDNKTTADPDPPHPAPVLQLAAGPGAPRSAGVTSTTSAPPQPAPSSTVPTGLWIFGGILLVIAVVGGVLWARRRRGSA